MTRQMLEDMGVTIFEKPGMSQPAYWLAPERTVIIIPDADAATWGEVADLAMLGHCVPTQRAPSDHLPA